MVRRFLGALLPFLAVFITGFAVALAQPGTSDLCYPDCPSDAWTGYGAYNHTFTLTSCGTLCQVRVWFVTRTATCDPGSPYTDVQIYRIEYVSGSWSGCNMDATINETVKHLLTDGVGPFKVPQPGFCIETYRVSIGSCLKYVTISTPSPMTAIRSCATNGCCLARYEVCQDNNHIFFVSTVFTSFPEVDCDNDPETVIPQFPYNPLFGDVTSSPCSPHCDALEVSGPIGKPATGNGIVNRDNDVQILTEGSMMTVLCRPEKPSNGLMEVYDVTGRKVGEVNPTIDNGSTYSFTVDRDQLRSGIYYYRITFNGANFTSGEIGGSK